MRARQLCWAAVACMLFTGLPDNPAAAAAPPAVAKHIPRDAAYVVFVSNPGEALTNLDAVLGRFKSINPEMDLQKQGEQLEQMLGVNPLTPAGIEAAGLDPAGTSALYATDPSRGFLAVLALEDAGAFEKLLVGLIAKTAQDAKVKPKRKAGVAIYEVDRGYIGVKAPWCVVLPPEGVREGQKDKQLLAFFKKGRKLAANPAFKQAAAAMPAGVHAWFFADVPRLASSWIDAQESELVAMHKYRLQHAPKADKKRIRKQMRSDRRRLKTDRARLRKALAFANAAALGWTVLADRIDTNVFVSTTRAGRRLVKKMFPALAEAPAFHQGLSEISILGGWMSLDLMGVLDQFGSLPAQGDLSIRQAMQQDAKGFKQQTGVDLLGDVLDAFAGPAGFYWMPPGEQQTDAQASSEEQVLRMLKLAMVAQVAKPRRFAAVLAKLDKLAVSQGQSPAKHEAGGTTLSSLQPAPGLLVTWGLKGDTLLLTLGEGTADALVTILPDKAWPRRAAKGALGAGEMDFAKLTEAVSSAVAQGVGGESAKQFRMMGWPIAQQVLAKFDEVTSTARLTDQGIEATASLRFR